MGTAWLDEGPELVASLDEAGRAALRGAGVVLGKRAAWVPGSFSQAAMLQRLAIALAYHGGEARLPVRTPGAPSMPAPRGADPAAYAAIGYAIAGRRAVRVDVLDRVLAARAPAAEGAEMPDDGVLARWLQCSPRDVPLVVEAWLAG